MTEGDGIIQRTMTSPWIYHNIPGETLQLDAAVLRHALQYRQRVHKQRLLEERAGQTVPEVLDQE